MRWLIYLLLMLFLIDNPKVIDDSITLVWTHPVTFVFGCLFGAFVVKIFDDREIRILQKSLEPQGKENERLCRRINEIKELEGSSLTKNKINEIVNSSLNKNERNLKSTGMLRPELKSQARQVVSEMNRFVSLYEDRQEWNEVRHVYHNKIKNAAQIQDALLEEIEKQRQERKLLSRIRTVFRSKKRILDNNIYSSPTKFEDVKRAIGELEYLLSELTA